MRMLFPIAIGSTLIIAAMAQQRIPPPVATAPPPAAPGFTPARPQPGVATGVAGGIGSLQSGTAVGPGPANPGVSTPFPVVVPPNTFPVYPEPLDPLDLVLESEVIRMLQEAPPNTIRFQGRPGGLGVTITGGSSNLPAVTNTPATANAPIITNTPAVTNATGGTVTNQTYP